MLCQPRKGLHNHNAKQYSLIFSTTKSNIKLECFSKYIHKTLPTIQAEGGAGKVSRKFERREDELWRLVHRCRRAHQVSLLHFAYMGGMIRKPTRCVWAVIVLYNHLDWTANS